MHAHLHVGFPPFWFIHLKKLLVVLGLLLNKIIGTINIPVYCHDMETDNIFVCVSCVSCLKRLHICKNVKLILTKYCVVWCWDIDVQFASSLKEVDWEVELAFVIGKRGKHIMVSSITSYLVLSWGAVLQIFCFCRSGGRCPLLRRWFHRGQWRQRPRLADEA